MNLKKLLLLFVFTLTIGGFVSSAEKTLDINIINDGTIGQNLRNQLNRHITLKLHSGNEITGKLTHVGPGMVLISSLRQPGNYYSALVPIEHIEALVFRVHDGTNPIETSIK